jgi:hypothetical protein
MIWWNAAATVPLKFHLVPSHDVFAVSCDALGSLVRCQGGARTTTMMARVVVYTGDTWRRVRTCSNGSRSMPSMPIFLLFLMTLEIGDALPQLAPSLAAVILKTSNREETAKTGESTSGSQEHDPMITLLLVEITIECRHVRDSSFRRRRL